MGCHDLKVWYCANAIRFKIEDSQNHPNHISEEINELRSIIKEGRAMAGKIK